MTATLACSAVPNVPSPLKSIQPCSVPVPVAVISAAAIVTSAVSLEVNDGMITPSSSPPSPAADGPARLVVSASMAAPKMMALSIL